MCLLRPTLGLGRATLKRPSIWSCTRWGLQSFSSHLENWCALTAPFHPYLSDSLPIQGKAFRRYPFCCTFLHVTATPRYGAPCPLVFGLSSGFILTRRSFRLLWPHILNNIIDIGVLFTGNRKLSIFIYSFQKIILWQ